MMIQIPVIVVCSACGRDLESRLLTGTNYLAVEKHECRPTATDLPDILQDPVCDNGESLARQIEADMRNAVGEKLWEGLS